MATTYTGRGALFIALFFCFLDLTVTTFGLAWNGRNFTFDNIGHWFNELDPKKYDFCSNPMDFLFLAFLRMFVLLGGALAVWCRPATAPANVKMLSNLNFALMLLIVAFSPTKLLAFAEVDDPPITSRLAVGDWILMTWSLLAALFVQAVWGTIFANVKPNDCYLHLPDDSDSRVEAEKAAAAKETFELIGRLATYMLKEWPFYILAFSCLFAYSIARVFIPYFMGEVVASVMPPDGKPVDYSKLNACVGYMALLSFAGAVFGGLRGGSFTYAQARVDRRIRNDLFRALVHQEIGFFDANKTGEITSRLNADCQTMSNTLSLYVNVLMRNITMLFGSMIFMFSLSWRLSMVTFIAVPIIFLISKIYGVYYDRLAEEAQTSIAKANDVAEEVISSMRTVKSFACEKFEALRFLDFLNITLKIATRKSLAHVGFLWTSELLQMGILVLVLWFGGHLVLKEKVQSGLLVSFLLYQFQLGENLRELGEVWNGLMQSVGASRKVFEFIDRVPVIKNDGKVDGNNMQLTGKIEFKNVKFSYPLRPDVPIMKDLTFTVNPGEVVALVGPSGGGKSSCIALLEHFYEPVAGQILLDGIPIRDYEHKFIHMKIALVGQEPVLYARSVRENIGYGMENASVAEIQNAAIMANAHSFIMDTTDQYETDVGEKGSQMSGGQKQRIAIARALVRHPVVLLLDEATSALDSESEHLVQEAIYKNLHGKTVILIAHRLSTVEKADKIIVINKGRVEQMGVHQELLQQDGIYKTLVQRQMLGTENTGEVEKGPPQMKPVARPRRIETPSAGQSIAHSMLGTSFASNSPFV